MKDGKDRKSLFQLKAGEEREREREKERERERVTHLLGEMVKGGCPKGVEFEKGGERERNVFVCSQNKLTALIKTFLLKKEKRFLSLCVPRD